MGTDLEQQRPKRIAEDAEQLAEELGGAQRRLLDKLHDDLDNNRIFGAATSQTLLNVSKAQANLIEKIASPLQNRPSHIVEHTAQELWAELQRLAPAVPWQQIAQSVDTTAEELPSLDTQPQDTTTTHAG